MIKNLKVTLGVIILVLLAMIFYKLLPTLTKANGNRGTEAGLSEDQVVAAKVRWSVFEKWANEHSEYRGWQSDPGIFKKANAAFQVEMKEKGPRIKIIK